MRARRLRSLPAKEKGLDKNGCRPSGGADPAGIKNEVAVKNDPERELPLSGGAISLERGMGLEELTRGKRPEGKNRPAKKKAAEKSCQLRQRLQLLLELPLTDPKQKEVLKDAGLPVRYRDRLQLVAWNLYQKALDGDLAAIRELRSILAEGKPVREKGRREDPDQKEKLPVVIVDDVR